MNECNTIYIFVKPDLTLSESQGYLSSCFPQGVTCTDCFEQQEVEELFLQHVILTTAYVNTAKNRNFHNKFNLSFNSIIFSFNSLLFKVKFTSISTDLCVTFYAENKIFTS